MEVLKLKPLRNKKVMCFVLKRNDKGYSTNEFNKLRSFIDEADITFMTFDVYKEEIESFRKTNLYQQFNTEEIPEFCLDVPEYAKGYLMEEIFEKEGLLNELSSEYENLPDKNSFKAQNLNSWIEILKDEIKEKKEFYEFDLRPQWITKKILDLAKNTDQKKVSLIHFAQEIVLSETLEQLADLEVNMKIVDDKSKINSININYKQEEVKQW
ncbi:MAG: hypothetical protein ACOC44_18550 [Promethearchaeia archaeon]